MQSGISKQSGKLRQLARQKWFACAVLAFVTTAAPAYAFDTTAGVDNQSDFEQKYEKITVQLLLLGLDFEQYSLKYRMDALHDSRLKRTRYFLGQEAAAAGSLTAAIIGTDQTYKAIHSPQRVSTHALRNLQTTGEVTSIIGASSSGLELAANSLHAVKDKIGHKDCKSATAYLTGKLKEIDKLLAEREALLASNSAGANSSRMTQCKAETRLLNIMRDTIVNEHKKFEVTKVGFRTSENVFYFANIGTSIVSALQYKYGYKSVRKPKFGGTSAVCSTVSAAMVMANPVIASVSSRLAKYRARKELDRDFGVVSRPPTVDELKQCVTELQSASASTKEDRLCQITAEAILDAYGVVNQIFPRELESEIALLHTLDQVAVQNIVLSQPIGGAALASGITSVLAYYDSAGRPLEAAHLNHTSSICGAVGAGIATSATALGYGFETWNLHRLRSKGQLPEQLMQERLTASKNVTARLLKKTTP